VGSIPITRSINSGKWKVKSLKIHYYFSL